MQQKKIVVPPGNDILFSKIAAIIEKGRTTAASAVNFAMVYTYREIGRMIFENEQKGSVRAEYGKGILKELSFRLTEKFGKGFSVDNLERMKNFFLMYPDSNSATLLRNSENNSSSSKEHEIRAPELMKFALSWSHYLVLMRIEQTDARRFYEIEAAANQWSLSELKRQVNSAIVELTLPKDSTIFAAEYSLYLPEKKMLEKKLKEWVKEFERREDCSAGVKHG